MKFLALIALSVIPFRQKKSDGGSDPDEAYEKIGSHEGSPGTGGRNDWFTSRVSTWKSIEAARKGTLSGTIVGMRDAYLAAGSESDRKRLADELFVYLEPHINYRCFWLGNSRGWPRLELSRSDHADVSIETKEDVIGMVYLMTMRTLSKNDWDHLRSFQETGEPDCRDDEQDARYKSADKFGSFLNTVVATKWVDVTRQVCGTQNRDLYDNAKALGPVGIKLYNLAYVLCLSPESARERMATNHNIELTQPEVDEMLIQIGPVPAQKGDPDAPLVVMQSAGEDGEDPQAVMIDSGPDPEEVLIKATPASVLLETCCKNKVDRYIMNKMYPLAGEESLTAKEISGYLTRAYGKGFSEETVRTRHQGILNCYRKRKLAENNSR
jgi:uncharacterized protein YciI